MSNEPESPSDGGSGSPPASSADPGVESDEPGATRAESSGSLSPTLVVQPTSRQRAAFRFTGQAGDYFRIWIVNLLLTLITIGLWSPWAKVRKRRYFYGHTWLGDANFEYHGNPVAILRGRLIAAGALGIYWVLRNLLPSAAPWLLGVLLAGAPWIITRSMMFNAANSSHRGIRFRFSGTVKDVARAIWPLAFLLVAFVAVSRDSFDMFENYRAAMVQIFSVYAGFLLVYPYVVAQIRMLTIGRSAWGTAPFSTSIRVGQVYGIYLRGIGVCAIPIALFIVLGLLMGFLSAAMGQWVGTMVVFAGLGIAGWAGVFIVWTSYNKSRLTNLSLDTTRLAQIAQLHCTISARALAKIYAVNLVAILGTAGLLIPWAVIRLARYRLQSISAEIEAPLEQVAAGVVQDPRATGEELSEMLGFDLAL